MRWEQQNPAYAHYFSKPEPSRDFEEPKLLNEPWSPPGKEPEKRAVRAWVYRYQRYRHEPPLEALFLSFPAPLFDDITSPPDADLVHIDQPGRWETLNPTALCFRPAQDSLNFTRLLVNGLPCPVEGR